MNALRRQIHTEARVLDERTGHVRYLASAESVDSYNEVIRVRGWRFDLMREKMPLVNSHRYGSIEDELGSLSSWQLTAEGLVVDALWAVEVKENRLAQLGFQMIKAGHGGRCSVGFVPEEVIRPTDASRYNQQLAELKLPKTARPSAIYDGQQLIELSAVVLGANYDAIALSFKSGAINESDLEYLSNEHSKRSTAPMPPGPAAGIVARQQARQRFLDELERLIRKQ